MVQKTTIISIPDDKVEEAKDDIRRLYDPRSLCFSDGYYAKSLVEKWGMPVSDLVKLVGRPVYKEEWVIDEDEE